MWLDRDSSFPFSCERSMIHPSCWKEKWPRGTLSFTLIIDYCPQSFLEIERAEIHAAFGIMDHEPQLLQKKARARVDVSLQVKDGPRAAISFSRRLDNDSPAFHFKRNWSRHANRPWSIYRFEANGMTIHLSFFILKGRVSWSHLFLSSGAWSTCPLFQKNLI